MNCWSAGPAHHSRKFDSAVRKVFFSPRINFRCRLSYGVRKPKCAIAYMNMCAHAEEPAVHVTVRGIMKTLKHSTRTVGWVARLCRSWLSPGKATRISYWRNHNGTIQLLNKTNQTNHPPPTHAVRLITLTPAAGKPRSLSLSVSLSVSLCAVSYTHLTLPTSDLV